MSDKIMLVACKPHQLGWLRRPELDNRDGEAWELPSGELYRHHGHAPLIVMKPLIKR